MRTASLEPSRSSLRNLPHAACALALALLALLACGSGKVKDPGPTWTRDVKPILEARCEGCHSAGGIAPFEMTTYAQAFEKRGRIEEQVLRGAMPPWPPGAGCADYAGDRSLPAADKETLLAWLKRGAPQGDPGDKPVTRAPPQDVGPSRIDAELKMKSAYTPRLSPDDYRCFVIDWPEVRTRFVTGFVARPGNAAIVHHVLAFLVPPDQAAAYQARDTGSGYSCFAGAGGNLFSLLGAWVPGSTGSRFPAGTGFKVLPGSKVILQVHYNTLSGSTSSDQTTLGVTLDDSVAREAYALPFADPSWITRKTMGIPAGAPDVEHSFQFDPSPYFGYLSGNVIQPGKPYVVYSAALHMHLRATAGRLEIERTNGDKECLLDIPHWDFHWQGSYGFSQAKVVQPGDKLSISCHWDNSIDNQPMIDGQRATPQDLNWGEGTSDEMCLGFMYVTQ